jgi:hypothetical protein
MIFLLGLWTVTAASAAVADAPAINPPSRLKQIIVVFKSHFDIGYTAMAKDVVQEYRTTMIDRTLAAIDKNRDLPKDQQFVWTVPGWPMAQMLWSGQDPLRKKRIEQAFREGNLAVHALPFTTHTETLGLEELVRGLGFSSRLARAYGLELPRGAKMTDVCCHTWSMATLLKHAGVDFFHIGCNDANQAAALPILFWWEGPDGSRLMTMYTHTYGTWPMPPAGWPHATWLAILHTSDNAGPPPPEHVKAVLADLKHQAPNAKVKIGQLSDFYDAIMAEKPVLPVVRGDMPDMWIHGPMSAPAGCKIAQNIRPMIGAAETLGMLSKAWGLDAADSRDTIAAAYEKSLLYGEHTWGLATQNVVNLVYGKAWDDLLAKGLDANYRRCEASWDEHEGYIKDARSLVEPLLSAELKNLADHVKVDGKRIVVFNPLPWKRSGVVTVTAGTDRVAQLKCVDDGQTVPVGVDGQTIHFVARDVPSLGYRTYVASEPAPQSDGLAADLASATIESPTFKAKLDPARGAIASLIDKRLGRELVDQSAPGGFGQYFYERFGKKEVDDYVRAFVIPQWMFAAPAIAKTGVPDVPYRATTASHMKLRIVKSAVSVSAVMSTPATEQLPHAVSITLTLYRDLPVADLDVAFEKKADGWPEAGWIYLPLKVDPPTFRLGRLGSIVDAVADTIDGCNSHLLWLNSGMTVTNPSGAGIGLCPIDSPLVSLGEPGMMRYSRRFVPKQARVYVNLFNNQYHTNFRSWWGGSLSSRVRLWAFDKYQAGASLYEPGIEARTPLLAAASHGPAGSLPVVQSGLELSRRGVAVTAFGPNPDGPGTLLRLWEQTGRKDDCTIRLPSNMKVASVQPVDLRGRPTGSSIPVSSGTVIVPLKAFAPASFVLGSQ